MAFRRSAVYLSCLTYKVSFLPFAKLSEATLNQVCLIIKSQPRRLQRITNVPYDICRKVGIGLLV